MVLVGILVLCMCYTCLLETLSGVLYGAPVGDSVVLLRDFNAHVGNDGDTWRGVVGRNGLPTRAVVCYWTSVLVMDYL